MPTNQKGAPVPNPTPQESAAYADYLAAKQRHQDVVDAARKLEVIRERRLGEVKTASAVVSRAVVAGDACRPQATCIMRGRCPRSWVVAVDSWTTKKLVARKVGDWRREAGHIFSLREGQWANHGQWLVLVDGPRLPPEEDEVREADELSAIMAAWSEE